MGMEKFCGYGKFFCGYGKILWVHGMEKNLWIWVWTKICAGMKFWSLEIFVGHEIFFGYPDDV